MRTVLAYILVIPLVQFGLAINGILVGFPIALLLARTSVSVRVRVAGVFSGIAGVLLAVAFGYGVFHVVAGPGAFTVGPFLASTVPLLLPIRNDYLNARKVATARDQLISNFAQSTPFPRLAATAKAEETQTGHGSTVVGEIVGLVLAAAWFVTR